MPTTAPARRVLVHMGHVSPREPGFTTQTGAAGEIEEVEAIGKRLYALLDADARLTPTLCGGDVPDGWTGDIVLALHCDGSSNPAARGYSLGWPPAEYGPKTLRLIDHLETRYEAIAGHPPHHSDNYTADMRGYYAWHRTHADAKVLVEHGFLSNEADRLWLQSHVLAIAQAWYLAVLDYYGLALQELPTWEVVDAKGKVVYQGTWAKVLVWLKPKKWAGPLTIRRVK